jgi:hypothetical protein
MTSTFREKLDNLVSSATTTTATASTGKPQETPFWCYGFVFDHETVYISDTSFIPTKTWDILHRAVLGEQVSQDVKTNEEQLRLLPYPSQTPRFPKNKIKNLILDCLRVQPHASHLSYVQALAVAIKLNPSKTWLVGFTHPDRHVLWEHVGRVVRGDIELAEVEKEGGEETELNLAKKEFETRIIKSASDQGLERIWNEAVESWKGWVEPAWDGMIVKG